MKIAMFSNTFLPQSGGVTRSLLTARAELAARGHDVLLVAPGSDAVAQLPWVATVPTWLRVPGTEWPAPIALPLAVRRRVAAFAADIIHAHHPFLLGRSASRLARELAVPCVFTCHTRYDLYARLSRLGGPALERAIGNLVTGFCNDMDCVIAPSRSLRDLLRSRGVYTDIDIVPTGFDADRVLHGDGNRFRAAHGIPHDGFVIGHIGRLTGEKNLDYLLDAIIPVLAARPGARFLLGGDGPKAPHVERRLAAAGLWPQVVATGHLHGRQIADALAAMDVFAFASVTETQGIVLLEAQAAGCPVLALDAPGVRDTVPLVGGWLLPEDSPAYAFSDALCRLEALPPAHLALFGAQASKVAQETSSGKMAEATLTLYRRMIAAQTPLRAGGMRMTVDLY